MTRPARRYLTYQDFWPYYLGEHRASGTRRLHFLGTGLALLLLALSIFLADWRLVPLAIVAGYAFAWTGHAFVERNRPATFTYPLWSLISDFRMFGLWLTGRLGAELRRHGVD